MDPDYINRIKARTAAMADQAWAELGEDLADIQRVAIAGPHPGIDDALIRRVFAVVTSELYTRSAERGDDDDRP